MNKLIITVGLPGSGKTHWSKEMQDSDKKNIFHLDIDYHMFENWSYKDIEDEQERFLKVLREEFESNYDTVIIDGLFLNSQDVIKILQKISYLPDETLEIHYWKEDIEACLWNDKGRREEDSESTIKNFKLEEIDIDEIKQAIAKINEEEMKYALGTCHNFDIKIIEHDVERKPDWKTLVDDYGLELNERDEIQSAPWKTGGEWWSYTGAGGDIEPEPQPSSFDKLDELFNEMGIHVSLSQYRIILNECVTTRSDTKKDYYSTEYIEYFVCDVEKLYETLNAMNLID